MATRKTWTRWTDEQEQWLTDNYSNNTDPELVVLHNAKFETPRTLDAIQSKAHLLSLKKSPEHLKSDKACRNNWERLKPYQFKKGQVNVNAGKKWYEFMSPEAYERCKETYYKKGQANKRKVPLGTENVWRDGRGRRLYWRKLSETYWKQVHHLRWEEKYGTIPHNYFLKCKTTDTLNTDPENWELFSRLEHLQRISINRMPPELQAAVRALGTLTKVINYKLKKQSK